MKIIVEGVDRMGKDTLIQGLINELGYHTVIHYSKPKVCDYYMDVENKLYAYQYDSFENGFRLLNDVYAGFNLIFNRFHLGEFVYAPRYRGYDGSYVFELEKEYPLAMADSILVLLITSNFSIMTDDGQSFDFTKREEEQDSFIEAFDRSKIVTKLKINVYDYKTGKYKNENVILEEVLEVL